MKHTCTETYHTNECVFTRCFMITFWARSNSGCGTCWFAASKFLTRAPANSLSFSVINVKAKPFSPVQ